MKVIDGGFGQQGRTQPMGEYLIDAIKVAGIDKMVEGEFVLLISDEEQFRFVSSVHDSADVVFVLEKAKQIIFNVLLAGAGVKPNE